MAIGFKQYDDKKNEEVKKKKEPSAPQKILIDLLGGGKFSPSGTTEERCYKTLDEIVFEFSQVYPFVRTDIVVSLQILGYKTEFVGGVPYWVLYDKTPLK